MPTPIRTLRHYTPDWFKNLSRPLRQRATQWRVRTRMLAKTERLTPAFLIIGAMKAGTTALFRYLTQHPLIAQPLTKEVHYFNHNWSRPKEWYYAHFPAIANAAAGSITGEASPGYLVHPRAAARAHQILPDARIIVLLRDPVERALSHYFHERRIGREDRPIEEAMFAVQSRTTHTLSVEEERRYYDALTGRVFRRRRDVRLLARCPMNLAYISHSLYTARLATWIEAYSRAQILVLRSADLASGPVSVLSKTLKFLSMDDFAPSSFPAHNVGTYPETVPVSVIEGLTEVFASQQSELAHLLEIDFPALLTDPVANR